MFTDFIVAEPPSLERIIVNLYYSKNLKKYKYLKNYFNIIKIIAQTYYVGNYTSYILYGKKRLERYTIDTLKKYIIKINKYLDFFVKIIKIKIFFSKFLSHYRHKLYKPNGNLYLKIKNNTKIGKINI